MPTLYSERLAALVGVTLPGDGRTRMVAIIVAGQSGRVTYDGAGGESEARIGNRRDWSERTGWPKRAQRKEPKSEETRESFGGQAR